MSYVLNPERLANKSQTNGYASLSGGVVPAAELGSGESVTTKFLRGDNTWQTEYSVMKR